VIRECDLWRHKTSAGRVPPIRHQRNQAWKLARNGAVICERFIDRVGKSRCLFFIYNAAAHVIWNIYCLKIYS
jgi:hypothetical protein